MKNVLKVGLASLCLVMVLNASDKMEEKSLQSTLNKDSVKKVETKIKESTIDLDFNSSMPIEINNTKAFLISLDFNNVIIVYKKDNEVITKKIPNTRIKSKGYEKETLIKEHEKALEELNKMVKGLQPVIEIEKDVLVQLIK